MSWGERAIKAAIGIVVLAVLFMMVMNWVGDYRAAKDGTAAPSSESTDTVEPTGTPDTPAGGEGATAPATGDGKTVVVLVDGLNFRAAASRDAELIRGLDANEKLVLLGEESGWLKVRDSKGETGYVSASGSYTRVE